MSNDPIPVLLYHSVSEDPPAWIAPFAVTPDMFGRHLEEVVASGRTAITVSQLADGIRGLARLPERPVVITADDGFADFAENAVPALARRNLPSTLYVSTGSVYGSAFESALPPARMIAWSQVAELEEAGVEIGAHSHTHRQLDLLSLREVTDELRKSGDLLAASLGHPIRSFAYPHGYWRRAVREQVVSAGYESACGVGNSLSSRLDHLYSLARLMVTSTTSPGLVGSWLRGTSAPVGPGGRRLRAWGWRQYRRLTVSADRRRGGLRALSSPAERQPGSREDGPA